MAQVLVKLLEKGFFLLLFIFVFIFSFLFSVLKTFFLFFSFLFDWLLGRKFMIPEVMWNVFDRPNAPLEKRISLSPTSAKIMEATQPSSAKRRHEEEEEDDDEKEARERKDTREREREKEREDADKSGATHGDSHEQEQAHSFPEGTEDAVVRLRGLPWSIKEDDIRQFFKDVTVAPGGLHFEIDATGKRNGEGYVRLLTAKDAEEALKYDHKVLFP
jgi:hypothetical protein